MIGGDSRQRPPPRAPCAALRVHPPRRRGHRQRRPLLPLLWDQPAGVLHLVPPLPGRGPRGCAPAPSGPRTARTPTHVEVAGKIIHLRQHYHFDPEKITTPDRHGPPGHSPNSDLEALTGSGDSARYPQGSPRPAARGVKARVAICELEDGGHGPQRHRSRAGSSPFCRSVEPALSTRPTSFIGLARISWGQADLYEIFTSSSIATRSPFGETSRSGNAPVATLRSATFATC